VTDAASQSRILTLVFTDLADWWSIWSTPTSRRARGVRALASLRRNGASARGDVERDLEEAAALIERSGATTVFPSLCEWRAELAGVLGDAGARAQLLRDAEQGFTAIGAPLQAERIRALR
jgi:hypothetical protein